MWKPNKFTKKIKIYINWKTHKSYLTNDRTRWKFGKFWIWAKDEPKRTRCNGNDETLKVGNLIGKERSLIGKWREKDKMIQNA